MHCMVWRRMDYQWHYGFSRVINEGAMGKCGLASWSVLDWNVCVYKDG